MRRENVITIGVVSAIFFLILVQGVAAEQTYGYVMQWGSPGHGNGQFKSPLGIAVDSSGNVYVGDSGNHRIQKFTSDGQYVTEWGYRGTITGHYSQIPEIELDANGKIIAMDPWGIATDSGNNVYVADSGNNSILKFTSEGKYIALWGSAGTGNGQFDKPEGVAVDGSGNVYVGDSGNRRIQKFTSDGKYITQWDISQYGLDLPSRPVFVATDGSGNVFVASESDLFVNFILKFTSSGKYISGWNEHHYYVNGITADAEGNTYISVESYFEIQKYAPTEELITRWGGAGTEDGKFTYPAGIDVDKDGYVYVVDSGNNRIQKFALTTLTITSNPSGQEIFVNGKDIGHVTPYTITDISPGVYTVNVGPQAQGQYSTNSVIVKAGKSNSITIDLPVKPTTITQAAPAETTKKAHLPVELVSGALGFAVFLCARRRKK